MNTWLHPWTCHALYYYYGCFIHPSVITALINPHLCDRHMGLIIPMAGVAPTPNLRSAEAKLSSRLFSKLDMHGADSLVAFFNSTDFNRGMKTPILHISMSIMRQGLFGVPEHGIKWNPPDQNTSPHVSPHISCREGKSCISYCRHGITHHIIKGVFWDFEPRSTIPNLRFAECIVSIFRGP
jgi:hypothetical protein